MSDRGAADTARVRALVPFPHGGDLAAVHRTTADLDAVVATFRQYLETS